MSMELIAIISLGLTVIIVGIVLAGLILNGQRTQRTEMNAQIKSLREEMQSEFKTVREEIGGLRERMAHVEGLLEGLLREVFIGRRAAPAEAVAGDPGPYDKR